MIDGTVPVGENWHQLLLLQMAKEIAEVRPAVITSETQQELEEYRGFRHVVRNIYTYNFNSKKVEKLVDQLPVIFTQARTDLEGFCQFLWESK